MCELDLESNRASIGAPTTFGFGALFYEMLSGQDHFQERTPIETMSAIPRKAPVKMPLHIPPPDAMIVERCLQTAANRAV
jgi:hypothetical protein